MDNFEILSAQIEKYQIKKTGIIHIGAHLGEEAADYQAIGFEHVLWMEANPELFDALQGNVSKFGHLALNQLLSDSDAELVDFYITDNDGHSSSMLAPTDAYIRSGLNVSKKFTLKSTRFDTCCATNNINLELYNCVNIDVQGAELKVLKGFGSLLGRFDIIITEVSFKRVYEGSVMFHELNDFFLEHGFIKIYTSAISYMGEAMYKKSNESISRSFKIRSNLFCRIMEYLVATGLPEYLFDNQNRFLGSLAKKIYRKALRRFSS